MGMGSLPYGKSLIPRPFALVSGMLVVGAAAAAGWLAAGQLADEPVVTPAAEAMTITAGTAQLQLRAGWQPQTKVPRVPGLEAVDAKALAPADGGRGRMVVSLVQGETADLPAATVAALRVPLGKPERATVGGLRGTGYTALSLRGVNGLVDFYTFKTVAGLLAISCIAPIDDPLPAGSCPADISAIAVNVPQAPDPAAPLKTSLPKVTGELDKARLTGRLALRRGADSDAQAAAARSLSRAYESAAAGLAPVAPKSGAGASLPEAFRAASASYGALATAAESHDERAWSRARDAVNAAELEAATALAAVGS